MKIVARIRQLLSAKEDIAADVVEDIPELVEATPEPTFRRAIERPATPRPAPRALADIPVAATTVPLLREPPGAPTKGGVRLEGEGIEQPILDPSDDVLRRELERLCRSGPSHLALIAPDGSYLQAAGNAKRMTIEAHVVSPEGTTHVVLGRQGTTGPDATIVSTAGPIEVHASEVWMAPEALVELTRLRGHLTVWEPGGGHDGKRAQDVPSGVPAAADRDGPSGAIS